MNNTHVRLLVAHVYKAKMMELEQARFALTRAKEEVESCQEEVNRLDEAAKAFADFLAGK